MRSDIIRALLVLSFCEKLNTNTKFHAASNVDILDSVPPSSPSDRDQLTTIVDDKRQPSPIKQSLNTFMAQCESLEETLAIQKNKLSVLTDLLSSANAEYEIGRKSLNMLRDQVEMQAAEIQRTNNELSRAKSHLDVMEAQKAEIDADRRLLLETVESSIQIRALSTEVADLRSQNSILLFQNKRLTREMEQMAYEQREELAKLKQSSGNNTSGFQRPRSRHARINAVAGPSRITSHQSRRSPSNSPSADGGRLRSQSSSSALRTTGHLKHNDFAFAIDTQQELDDEELHLRTQWEQRLFKCGVCMEKQPKDYIMRLDPCEHEFGRDCIRNYVGGKIDEHCFPIFCPVCMVESQGNPSGT